MYIMEMYLIFIIPEYILIPIPLLKQKSKTNTPQ